MRIKTISSAIAGCLLSLGFVIGDGPARAADDACYMRAQDGTCLDDANIPVTGQYSGLDRYEGDGPTRLEIPSDIRASQKHGVVRLQDSAYIDAGETASLAGICRFVDNRTSHGQGVFIGLETRGEWSSFIAGPPAGVSLTACCRPVAVQVCGETTTIPYSKLGASTAISGGHSRVVTYTCGSGTAGAVPTHDTSWLVAEAGQCDAPDDSGPCPDGKRWYGHKNSPTGQAGCFGPGDWGGGSGDGNQAGENRGGNSGHTDHGGPEGGNRGSSGGGD